MASVPTKERTTTRPRTASPGGSTKRGPQRDDYASAGGSPFEWAMDKDATRRDEADVYDRLYSRAKEQVAAQHNDAVALLETYVDMPEAFKTWETTKVDGALGEARAAWAKADGPRAPGAATGGGGAPHVDVLEYDRDLDDLLELVSKRDWTAATLVAWGAVYAAKAEHAARATTACFPVHRTGARSSSPDEMRS